MTTTRRRADDAPSYDPSIERRPSAWNQLDTLSQRIIAIAAAFALLVSVLAWVGRTLSTEARLASLETQVRQMAATVSDTKSVVCFLARKSDQPITPPSCNSVTPP